MKQPAGVLTLRARALFLKFRVTLKQSSSHRTTGGHVESLRVRRILEADKNPGPWSSVQVRPLLRAARTLKTVPDVEP